MNVMDANHDGELTKSELKQGFTTVADSIRDQIKASHEAFVEEAFSKYDTNSDHTLSQEELAKIGRNFSQKFIRAGRAKKADPGPESPEDVIQRAVIQDYVKDLAKKNGRKNFKFDKENFKEQFEHAKEDIEERKREWKAKREQRKQGKAGKNKVL